MRANAHTLPRVGSLRQITVDGAIAVLRLDRPERRNALDSGLLIELVGALDRLSVDDELGRVVGAEEAAAIGLVHDTVPAGEAEAAALRLAVHVAAHDPNGVAILKAAFRELDGAQGRVAHENELLEVFQRKGAGLPQGPRP